jgi:hypothetical protein
MISFQEMLDGVSRVADMLKSESEVETTVKRARDAIKDLHATLDARRLEQFGTRQEIMEYIQKVVLPQVTGLEDTLGLGTEEQLKYLHMASEEATKLAQRLQIIDQGTMDGYL